MDANFRYNYFVRVPGAGISVPLLAYREYYNRRKKTMALTKEVKAKLVAEYGKNDKDTGSTEVQVAILTYEINELNEHFQTHIHDFSSKRGLMKKIGQRKALLAYLKDNDLKAYEELIKKLGLRR
jgi:small subunit ribosomal protein S15